MIVCLHVSVGRQTDTLSASDPVLAGIGSRSTVTFERTSSMDNGCFVFDILMICVAK